jgi:predicted kinase
MLIVFAGLPGTGKSSVARELAGKLDAVGYRAAFAVAGDNLRLGRIVVTDSVNDWMVTRNVWRDIGVRAGARVVEVEMVCSGPTGALPAY